MPAKAFTAPCDVCKAERTFEEFFREKRLVKSSQAMARGDFQMEMEYKFRCATCGTRLDKILDSKGVLHKWQGNKHVEMTVPR